MLQNYFIISIFLKLMTIALFVVVFIIQISIFLVDLLAGPFLLMMIVIDGERK